MGVKLGLSYHGMNTDRWCLRTALKRISGPKEVGVTRQWRKLHNEELQN
jgi:hypothetical protein